MEGVPSLSVSMFSPHCQQQRVAVCVVTQSRQQQAHQQASTDAVVSLPASTAGGCGFSSAEQQTTDMKVKYSSTYGNCNDTAPVTRQASNVR
jgi:hypothetical protein